MLLAKSVMPKPARNGELDDQSGCRVLLRTPMIAVGIFRCRPGDAASYGGRASTNLMVFARSGVAITREGKDEVLADSSRVMFYNAGERYTRRVLTSEGEHSEYFGVSANLLADTVRPFDPAAAARSESILPIGDGPVSPALFIRQRAIVRHLLLTATPDHAWVMEQTISVLSEAVGAAYAARAARRQDGRSDTIMAHARVAEHAREFMAARYAQRITLAELASAVHASEFHLCRIFKRQTGLSIHKHLTRLRLLQSLDRVADGHDSLAAIANDVGFSSHAHFTHAFRRELGITPSDARRMLNPACVKGFEKDIRV